MDYKTQISRFFIVPVCWFKYFYPFLAIHYFLFSMVMSFDVLLMKLLQSFFIILLLFCDFMILFYLRFTKDFETIFLYILTLTFFCFHSVSYFFQVAFLKAQIAGHKINKVWVLNCRRYLLSKDCQLFFHN